ncbi:MAG: hypothetical protein U0520_04370 [Candidatus Saccharimonadales bacterium]
MALLPGAEQERLAMHLYEEGLFGIKENPDEFITLKSGRKSPHYFDIRQGLSCPDTRELVAEAMVALALHRTGAADVYDLADHYEHFVGSPEAMTSYAASIADTAGMSLLQPRVNLSKVTGNKSPILGKYREGDRIAAFDDVITDGATKVETMGALGCNGLVVADYYVVLDRQEGGRAELQEAARLDVTPALGLATTVRILRANSALSQTQFDNVREYMERHGDPDAVTELLAA